MFISYFIRFCRIVSQVMEHIELGSNWPCGLCVCSSSSLDHPSPSTSQSQDSAVRSSRLIARADGGSCPVVRKGLGLEHGPDILNWFSKNICPR